MGTVTVSATVDTLIIPGDNNRKIVTITNQDATNAVFLRNSKKVVGTTSSTNFSYYLGPLQTFLARLGLEGYEPTVGMYFGLAAAGTPALAVEASNI